MIPAWVKDAVFYQIFPDRFSNGNPGNDPENVKKWGSKPTITGFQGGDLEGVLQKLDYLLDLGVNAVYLNPIFLSPSTHRYDTTDYFRIDPKLGDMGVFRRLIEAAHRVGIRIILDGVFNHTGRGFFAFTDILENGEESPYRNWFHIHNFPVDAYSPGKAKDYIAWWGFKSLPKLNTDHRPVRDYIFSVARYWIEQGADGWRLDVPNEIDDDLFWQEFRDVVRSANPNAYLVGEIWEPAPKWMDEGHFDGVMNYPLRDTIWKFLNAKITAEAAQQKINEFFEIYSHEQYLGLLNLLGSHDVERILTVLHGNRSLLKLANLILLTFPGAPCIYYGDEVGMTGGKDPACRGAYPWEERQRDMELFAWVRKLIQHRKVFGALRVGQYVPLILKGSSEVLAYARVENGQKFIVAVNRSKGFCMVDIDVTDLGLPEGKMLNNLTGEERFVVEGNGRVLNVGLPPESGVLLY